MEKKLNEMTVRDVITMPMFVKYVGEVIDGELSCHRKVKLEAIARGMKLHRMAIDSLIERGVMDAEKMVDLFGAVLDKSLIGFSSSEREYIEFIGILAFKRFMLKLYEDEKKKETH